MECNKDEAVRAMELSERKFMEKDYVIAKKFALKAQNLYPELDGLSQMLTVLDVYVFAEKKINGEVDWYGILRVPPFADDETIRKQYRKLAFMLHPDKNKSLGAEGAFMLVSEAWSLLSDKAKRLEYNQKMNLNGFQQVVPSRTGVPPAQPSASASQNVKNSVTSNARGQRGPTPLPSYRNATTFWTICNQCKTHYQYLRIYLNRTLLCPNCQKTFLAIEKTPPSDVFKSSSSSSSQRHQNSRHHAARGKSFSSGRNCSVAQNVGAGGSLGPNSFNHINLQQGSFSKMTSLGSRVPSGHAAAPAVNTVQQASEKVKKDQEQRQSIAEWVRSQNLMGNPSLKKRRMDDNQLNGYEGCTGNQMAMGNDGAEERPSGHAAAPSASTVQQASEKAKKDQERRQSIAEWARMQNLMGNPSLKKRRMDDNQLNGYEGRTGNQTAMGNDGAEGRPSGHAAAPAVSTVQQASEKYPERRQSIAEWVRSQNLMGNPSLKNRRMDDNQLNGYEGCMGNQMAKGNDGADLGGVSELSSGNVGTKRIYGFSSIDNMPKAVGELPYPEMKKLLIKKAQTEICKMLKEKISATEAEKAKKEQGKVKVDKIQKSSVNVDLTKNSDTDKEAESQTSINVPDPDFHNFDLDRTENSFGEDQVWAAYDHDGMPRYYARIHKVISLKPFKMRVSWLNSRSNIELGPVDWVVSGFTKTCGDFRSGKHEISYTLNSFSSKVSWTKSTRGVIRIFPRRGEVWALYRNWSPDWNQHTPDDVINKYEMVEVLDEFTEEHGVTVIPLSKVAGFRTVFRKRMDPKGVRRIPKGEMFRFSHQVPSHLLTGEEAQNAPKGCLELDPAATPSELLKVIIEADEEATKVKTGGITKEEIFQSVSTVEVGGGMEKDGFQKVENKPTVTDDRAYNRVGKETDAESTPVDYEHC